MDSVLAFYSDDPSSNPTDVYSFSVQFVFEINNYKQNRGRGWPIFHKNVITSKLAVKYFVIFQQLSFSPID